ncbi:putative RNA methyltransferase [Corallincola spongiicola]|uniref:Methyltransferase domain-containing protein n=1 Tax=Corallincola spongiicola TaxID=2520508 RepID=A0ABY1WTU0_9GAMM|nr:methyltransferase domain-containing protein [Corallincola spongiicola]TAA48053.1 methyltransferase domain-containing protein [Corallincola spongiicola]
MIVSPLNKLVCPLCAKPLVAEPSRLVCGTGHSFDKSRNGHVNLLPVQNKRSLSPGDSKQMVQWRHAFLAGGYYDAIAEKINDLVSKQLTTRSSLESYTVIDGGCGEGYYLTELATHLRRLSLATEVLLCGLDISKWAVQAAAKRDKSIQWIVASNKSIPVNRASTDLILCAFGFHCYDSFADTLKSGGVLILVDTYEDHLIEMRKLLYPTIKLFQPASNDGAIEAGFSLSHSERLTVKRDLPSVDIERLLGMTPHMHRAPKEGIEKVTSLEHLTLTIDVSFRVFIKD